MISESKPGVAQISRLSPLRLPPHQPLHKSGNLILQNFVSGFSTILLVMTSTSFVRLFTCFKLRPSGSKK